MIHPSWIIQKEIAEEEIFCWVLGWAGDYLENSGMNMKESAEQSKDAGAPEGGTGDFY